MGVIDMDKGDWNMSLKSLEMTGRSVIDFRLFLFERL